MLWVTRVGGTPDRGGACPWLKARGSRRSPAGSRSSLPTSAEARWRGPMYDGLYAFCQRKAAA